jgi:hypothetical protein
MAFTAFWIASVALELVEVVLEELDFPRSWASDSLVALVSKLDRSELMELVLIPLLLCTSRRAAQAAEGWPAILSANWKFP